MNKLQSSKLILVLIVDIAQRRTINLQTKTLFSSSNYLSFQPQILEAIDMFYLQTDQSKIRNETLKFGFGREEKYSWKRE